MNVDAQQAQDNLPPALLQGINIILSRLDALDARLDRHDTILAAQDRRLEAMAQSSSRYGDAVAALERRLDDLDVTTRHESRALHIAVALGFERLLDRMAVQRAQMRENTHETIVQFRQMLLELVDHFAQPQ